MRQFAAVGRRMQPSIRILCVDDNELLVEAIGVKLMLAGGFTWLGQLKDADRLVDEVERLLPDVVLLDVDMPGRNAFDALHELTRRRSKARALMFTGQVRRDMVDRAINAGAWGVFSKHDSAEALVAAIMRVMHGEFVLNGAPC